MALMLALVMWDLKAPSGRGGGEGGGSGHEMAAGYFRLVTTEMITPDGRE
jgi:hypothetical protein